MILAKGDHIRVKRMIGLYYHHGIDLGDGTCVHFTGEPIEKADAEIKRTSILSFVQDGEVEIVNYSKCNPVDLVVATALVHVGVQGYNLATDNCEHFARYCKTGQWDSEQIRDKSSSAGHVIGAAVTHTVVAGTVASAGTVAGLSGAGVMSGLAAIGPAGVIGGLGTLAAAPAVASNLLMNQILKDDECLATEERDSRTAGRLAAKVGTAAGAYGVLAAVSGSGAVAGLSGAGITSGLAAIGGTVGGGMVAGTALVVAAPAVATAAVGYGVYKFVKWLNS